MRWEFAMAANEADGHRYDCAQVAGADCTCGKNSGDLLEPGPGIECPVCETRHWRMDGVLCFRCADHLEIQKARDGKREGSDIPF